MVEDKDSHDYRTSLHVVPTIPRGMPPTCLLRKDKHSLRTKGINANVWALSEALQPLNISGQNMRLKIRIGINLAKSSHNRDEDDVHSQYCGTRRVFFILQSPKGTSKWLYYCMCHINDTVHPCSRNANVNRWTMMYMQNAQWVSTMLFPANT